MIDVTLLGTSALVPLPDRAETAALLVCSGRAILFDCGEGTQTAARKAGVSLMRADVIALTHYHGDHVFGLPGLLQTMSMWGRTEPLLVVGPGDLERELHHLMALAGVLPYPVRLVTIPAEGLDLHSLFPSWPRGARLTAFPTSHRVPSQGYAFTLPRTGKFLPEIARALELPVACWKELQRGNAVALDGRSIQPETVLGPPRPGLKVVFSGDTAYCDSLIQGAEGADLLLCEATYGEDDRADLARTHGHMNFAQAGLTAARAGAKRLWLMHYSQMVENPADYLPNAQAHFGDAECGFDGKHITLQFAESE